MGNTDGNINLDPPHYKSQQATTGNPYATRLDNPNMVNQYGRPTPSTSNLSNNASYGSYTQHQMHGGGTGKFHQQNYYRNGNNSVSDEKHNENATSQPTQQESAIEIFNSEAMNVCWVFWKDNVDILPRNKQKELALLLYCHMFQKIPSARRLFIRGEIDEQALKFLDMFGYLIRQLKDYESTNTLIKTLQSLGTYYFVIYFCGCIHDSLLHN